ncbi:hypothetical protein PPERSA_03394 [Pseudocohnilembus persalinus]|uniref:Radial spoke protein 3 n=1 Tax=Pseudocohnilembus persalinus TaxID=266149 RepID=A0A0V0Q7K1_PSEPJ|nr:hypothetical protein PPERSA_03394 [Pseudocohnilembus persalinus]|eukprot:KRW98192.1 hypothetical protein PPERSA_03394 [Pseudocohnilembus persalinus]
MQEVQGQTYDFQAKPRVLKPKSKYREQQYNEEEPENIQFQNMMFDKRVVRGNTYAAIVTSKNPDQFQDSIKAKKQNKRPLKQLEIDQNMNQTDQSDPGTPEPVEGRTHAALQTDEYIEILTDKPPNYEKDTQTDFYIDRPLVRIFMPKKDGIDKETQIWDGDLFDFDYEVQPILQVLIGKTLEQSRMEVLEEEELRIMKEQQKRFEQLRNAELAEMQKLESKEKRLLQENQNRISQYNAQKDQNILAHKKMISRIISKNHVGQLSNKVLEILRNKGVFRHPLNMTLLNNFVPWLYQEVQDVINTYQQAQKEITSIVDNVIEENKLLHEQSLQKDKEKKQQILQQKQLDEEARQKRIAEKKEAKRQKLEKERRQKIKEQILDQLVSKGELKPNVLQQLIADMDQSPDQPTIGLFGGIIGEFCLFLSYLYQISDDESQYQGLKDWLQNEENLSNTFKEIISLICQEGGIELQINEQIDLELAQLQNKEAQGDGRQSETNENENNNENGNQQGDLNINNWHLSPQEQIIDIQNIIKNNMYSTIIEQIVNQQNSLNIKPEIIEQFIFSLLSLIYQDDNVQQKIKWRKIQKQENYEQYNGIAYMKPNLQNLQVNEKSQRYGEVQESQNNNEDDEEEEAEPKPVIPLNLAEAEYENKQTVFPQKNDDLNVLVLHPIGELSIREEILKILSQQVASIQGKEFQMLMDSQEEIQAKQEQIIGKLATNLPMLDMESY